MDFVDVLLDLPTEYIYIGFMAKVIILVFTVNFVFMLFGYVLKILNVFNKY